MIFFNSLWLYGSFALLIYGMAFRQPSITALATLLLLTAGVSWLWNRFALQSVAYTRRLGATRLFRDASVTLHLELVNRQPLPRAWIEGGGALPGRGTSAAAPGLVGDAHPVCFHVARVAFQFRGEEHDPID